MKKLSVNLSKHIKLTLAIFLVVAIATAAEIENVNRVIAKVGDQIITSADLHQLIDPEIKVITERLSGPERQKQIEIAKKVAIQRLVNDKILLIEANKLELAIPEVEITKRINVLKSKFANEEAFLASLKERKMDLEKLHEMVKDEFKNQVLLHEKVAKKIRVLPTDIHEYYQLNIADFLQPSSVHMFQIMVKKKPDPKKSLALAQDIYKELEGGADFKQIARLRSQGPKKNLGGDWGAITRDFFGEDMKTVERSAFSLQPGKFGEIVETKFGYHIVFINSKRISRILSEREAYDKIYQQLFEMKFAKAYETYMNYLRDKTYIEIYTTDTPQDFTINTNK